MACYSPLKGWSSKSLSANGKRAITFNIRDAYIDLPRTVPCGQCVGCRLERSRQWAIRCHHEASLHEDNCFITLTYNEENLPADHSLSVRVFQLFMKRLRKKYPHKIRFYACGEYGDRLGRPHYHACLFGHQFPDLKLWKKDRDPLYRSPELEVLWPYGYSSIGNVTFNSAAYVARYIMKKINGPRADEHYCFIDEDGVIHQRRPEFTIMSRKPGVGALWLDKYASDIYPDDFVIINGKRMRPPRYYDENYERTYPDKYKKIQWTRKRNFSTRAENNTPERLRVREIIQLKKAALLVRNHDKENNT